MPIYCYKCFDCNHYEEVMQKISDTPLDTCPECGGNFKRVIRSVGVIFKGSGFHVNDYKSKNSALKDAEPEKKTESASVEKVEKKDEKPASAPKTETKEKTSGSGDKKDAA
ncbi:MAG: zinc ribbon domain-containing protein [Firmicutes bacterium]|nr:zinc ribbon domain-containing protein [Bacillota bacterium]